MKLILILCCFPLLWSFTFNPMSQSIELGAKQKTAQFLIENDSNESMAIELSVRERVMDVSGKEEHPKTSEMTIFPPQMIIPSKERRTIRVTWNGSSELKTERAFRVIAEQLPLNVDEKQKRKSGIQMLMRYMAALYVTPADAKSSLKGEVLSSAGNTFKLKVVNSGNLHRVLVNPVITMKKGEEKWTLKSSELEGLTGENVLAGSERHFSLKSKSTIPQDASVSIKVDE